MIVQTNDRFEAWDGGHCYLRITVASPETIQIHRSPNRLSDEEKAAFEAWKNRVFNRDNSKDENGHKRMIGFD